MQCNTVDINTADKTQFSTAQLLFMIETGD